MVTRLEACRELFRQEVLPKFPAASERFQRYFIESYELVRALPTVGVNIPKHNRDRGDLGSEPVVYFSQDIALTALGIKPLALEGKVARTLLDRFGPRILSDAGLEVLSKEPGMDHALLEDYGIYDPELVAPILSILLNRTIPPQHVATALKEYLQERGDAPISHELLGYPEARLREVESGYFIADSHDRASTPSYLAHFGCRLHTPQLVLPNLKAWASTAALVEEIRNSPPSVTSIACIFGIPGWGKRRVTMTIKRSAETVGNWDVSQENDFNQDKSAAAR